MKNSAQSASHSAGAILSEKLQRLPWSRLGPLYARLALGAAFLSGIADRFGLYTGRNVGYGDFGGFLRYTAQVNSFMPASTIPFLGWAATVAEFSLGLLLVLGVWRRPVAIASAILLVLFGTAMAISFGIKSPLDYSVFSASSAAALLALYEPGRQNPSQPAFLSGPQN
jgi:putative oxidoreductase